MHVITGFVVVDRAGEFLAWAEFIEVALLRLKETPLASNVERCSDGAVMAFRYSKKKAHAWEEAVAA